MRNFKILAVTGMIVTIASACGGGGSSSISDLGQVRDKLSSAGISCPKPPAAYKSDGGFSLGAADPKSELKCTSNGVKLTASLWKDASGKSAALTVAKSFICGFGQDGLSMIEGDNWALSVDDADVNTKNQDAALGKAAKALGIEPTTYKCGKSSSNEDKDASAGTDDPTETSQAPTTTIAVKGDRAKPLAVGYSAKVGDYEVTVDSIIPNATSQVQSANEFNDPPSKGQYAEVDLTATYKGSDEGTPSMDLAVALSGTDKIQYQSSDCMATVDTDDSTVEPGGQLSLKFCIDAPPKAITGGLIFIEPTFSSDEEDRVYWKVA